MQGEGSLSQADIDALLMGSEDADATADTAAEETPPDQTGGGVSLDESTSLGGLEDLADLGDLGGLDTGALAADEEPKPLPKAKPAHKRRTSSGGRSQYEDSENMELLLDVKMNLSVELGRAKMRVEEVLNLGSGAIVELDKLNGEYVDVMVNNRLVARGEVIAVDENFGVKIVEIIDPEERFKIEL